MCIRDRGKTADITSSTFTLNATATDDMGHPIHGGSYTFYLDDIRIGLSLIHI